jgi:GNAT superfamily N-acetyltransferase
VDVKPMPGLEHLPFAEVWFHEVDDERWREASAAARAIGKAGLEVWTTDKTPDVVSFLEQRGYEQVRSYVISELDVAAAPDPSPPAFPLVTFAERPDLAPALFEIALESYGDQPGRSEQRIESFESWRSWGLDPHPPAAYFIALEDERALGYGFLEVKDDVRWNGFMAIARTERGRGVAGAVKRGQIAWAKANGIPTLRTANETRLDGLLAFNRRLGYRPLYTEIVLRGPAAESEYDAAPSNDLERPHRPP